MELAPAGEDAQRHVLTVSLVGCESPSPDAADHCCELSLTAVLASHHH